MPSCPVLSCPVLSCPLLSCPVLSCPLPSRPVPPRPVPVDWGEGQVTREPVRCDAPAPADAGAALSRHPALCQGQNSKRRHVACMIAYIGQHGFREGARQLLVRVCVSDLRQPVARFGEIPPRSQFSDCSVSVHVVCDGFREGLDRFQVGLRQGLASRTGFSVLQGPARHG